MIYDGVQTKPPLEELYLEHGWVKDSAAKVHKYIERWRDAAGKWRYRYQTKQYQKRANKVRRKYKLGPEVVTINAGDKKAYKNNQIRYKTTPDYGRADSRAGQTGSKLDAGISAGRKRAYKKKYGSYSNYSKKTTQKLEAQNSLRNKGYSNSREYEYTGPKYKEKLKDKLRRKWNTQKYRTKKPGIENIFI